MKRRSKCLVVALLWAFTAGLLPAADIEAEPDSTIYIIPIEDMIENALLYVIRRGVAEAESEKADAIIFVMDTPGGTLDAATDIVRTINDISVPTYTLVQNQAFSAGAIIALATKKIYMQPGSVIGDAMPIMASPLSGPQEMPENLQEKMVSAVSALIRSAAEQGGHNPKLAEAMVRREIEYKIDDEIICPEGQLLTLTNVEAERLVGTNQVPLLSSGTVNDLDDMLERIGHSGAKLKSLHVTMAERVARVIAGFASVLLVIGLVGIYIEIRTPGFGAPGIIGAVALALFFWGHHIAGLAGMEEMAIFAVGFILLAIEIFVIPGFGITGITGIALMTWALLSAMVQRYPSTPWYSMEWTLMPGAVTKLGLAVIGAFILAVLLARFLPAMCPAVNRLVLGQATKRDEGYTASKNTNDLLGTEGVALARLRPAGPAQFGDRRLDTVTRGEFIDEGTRVRVVETHGSRIIVEACEASTEEKQNG